MGAVRYGASNFDIALAHHKLNYDSETGIFRWTKNVKFKVRPGAIAGAINKHGYRYLYLNGRLHRAARVAWAMSYGYWPEVDVDHINRVRDDERLVNLRLAVRGENCWNKSLMANNTTGYTGVGVRYDGRWYAAIRHNGVGHWLGTFDTPEEASAVYESVAERLQGRFYSGVDR